MFFNRKKGSTPSAFGPVAWDDETCEKIAGSNRFNVTVTSITRTVVSGKMEEITVTTHNPVTFEVHGIMTYPKYIVVKFEFGEQGEGHRFGVFSYDSMDRIGGLNKDAKVPWMHVFISDPKVAVEMYEAHRCALMTGRRHSLARVWKRPGEGLMTALDREHGYSYQSRYEVFGVTTWCTLEARNVPEWALPMGHERFSVRDLPDRASLMRLG
jgi:hypothetical protein